MTTASILIGTDFSTTSDAAIGLAQHIAKRAGLKLDIRHALPHPAFPAESYDNVPNDITPLYDAAVEQLKNLVDSLEEGLVLRSQVKVGPVTAVLKPPTDCVLVAVGHASRSAGNRFVRGSNATRVVRTTTPPVLIVPAETQVRPINKVLICDDFSNPSARIISTLDRLGLVKDMTSEVAFVLRDPTRGKKSYVAPDQKLYDQARERGFTELLMERTLKLNEGLGGNFTTRILKGGAPAETLVAYAREAKVDLIAIASTGKGAVERVLLGSVVESIMHSADCPVLVVH